MLAVRSLEKQRRKEEKQRRKLLKETFTPVESHVSPDANIFLRNSHVPNQPLSKNECAVESKTSSQLHVERKDNGETHVEAIAECKHGTDVLQNQRPSKVSLHVQSDIMKFGTQDVQVQNQTVGVGMHSEAAVLNVTTTHNPSDCYGGSERRTRAHSENSECCHGDSGMMIAGGKRDYGTVGADDVGSILNESGWDSRAMAEAVATVAVLSGRNKEEIFQDSSEGVDD